MALPIHQDHVAGVLNAARVISSVAVAAVLAIWSGIPGTAVAVLYTSVFVSLGSLQPDPRPMGNAGLFGMPVVVVLSTVYAFAVFPNIAGYPLFIPSPAPLVLLTCSPILAGQPGCGLVIGVQTLAQVAPADVQRLDPDAFVASATMLIPSGVAIFAAFAPVLPVLPAQSRQSPGSHPATLVRRIPVRIRIGTIPDGVTLSAGMTATVTATPAGSEGRTAWNSVRARVAGWLPGG